MKRALVTGAAARIGREMALYLGQQGYDVAVHYATSRQAAEDVVENLRVTEAQPRNPLVVTVSSS